MNRYDEKRRSHYYIDKHKSTKNKSYRRDDHERKRKHSDHDQERRQDRTRVYDSKQGNDHVNRLPSSQVTHSSTVTGEHAKLDVDVKPQLLSESESLS
jgi:hypothetical protein